MKLHLFALDVFVVCLPLTLWRHTHSTMFFFLHMHRCKRTEQIRLPCLHAHRHWIIGEKSHCVNQIAHNHICCSHDLMNNRITPEIRRWSDFHGHVIEPGDVLHSPAPPPNAGPNWACFSSVWTGLFVLGGLGRSFDPLTSVLSSDKHASLFYRVHFSSSCFF